MASGSPGTSRPTLIIHTVAFHPDEIEAARQLGLELFHELTRPLDDPLAFGAGIPVFCGTDPARIDPQAADIVALVPVLGLLAFNEKSEAVLGRIAEWREKLKPQSIIPVLSDPVWRNEEVDLKVKPLFTEIYEDEPRRPKTLAEIVLAVARLLAEDRDQVTLFVSHAKADLGATKQAAANIANYAKTQTTGRAFFDKTELLGGEPIGDQLDSALKNGVFVAVRSDTYSSRIWCQRELLCAKRNRLPTLTVELLLKGERRSLAYGGNGPTVVWDREKGDPAGVVSQAVIEWLRARYFLYEAPRILKEARLPTAEVMIRPPELLDLAQGPLHSVEPQLAMHPDPESTVLEREILKAANPRLHLVTPLTAYRWVLRRGGNIAGDAPLAGLQVGMSLSDSPEVDGPDGYTKHHVIDVTVQLARTLLASGASIGYGGDFRRPDMNDPRLYGYTILLGELIAAYKQSASDRADFLHSYLAAPIDRKSAPSGVPLKLHSLAEGGDLAPLSLMPEGRPGEYPDALYYSDMRRVMTEKIQARVLLGGAAEPRTVQGGLGYGGLYPGVVEEAWQSLKAKQPLYIVGGFGGAAALVADLLEGQPIPKRLQEATWSKAEFFRQNAEAIRQARSAATGGETEGRLFLDVLGLPHHMDQLADAVKAFAATVLKSDKESVAWNGLTVEENRRLFRSRDRVVVTSLVLKGLMEVSRARTLGKLAIELVHGSVTDARELDVIAVAMFDEIPLGGAGAALDEFVGGLASIARVEGRQLLSVGHSKVDADWVYLASLGRLGDSGAIEDRIREAARQTADTAQRHGFRRVGVVAYGGTVVGDVGVASRAMVEGLSGLSDFARVTWFEADKARFDDLCKLLDAEPAVHLTTRLMAAPSKPVEAAQPLFLYVSYSNGELSATALPPVGNPVALVRREAIGQEIVEALAKGTGPEGRRTPDVATLKTRGAALGTLLLGDRAEVILGLAEKSKTVVVHDVGASRIPFEMLRTSGSSTLASAAGLSRRLAVPGVPVEHLFARPAKAGPLKVLLVINPTANLDGAEAEGQTIASILQKQGERVDLRTLYRSQATMAALIEAFPTTDVLHYCGHAFFDGPGESSSGLILHGEERLTLTDLRGVAMPRVAFVNACEAGRVRGEVTTEAASFAEFFLRGGVEAYLGTFWRVNDAAAQLFSEEVYTRLAVGDTLDEGVTLARKKLQDRSPPFPDFANYLLYGDGRFRLVEGSP